MKRLSDMLIDPETSDIYILEERPSADHLEKLAGKRNLAFFHIEGQDIRNKNQFLEQAAIGLRLPEYFGGNWDAFEDCLTDMSWIESDGFVILYDHFESFAEQSSREFQTALDIFKDSVKYWRDQGKALFLLLHGNNKQVEDFPKLKL